MDAYGRFTPESYMYNIYGRNATTTAYFPFQGQIKKEYWNYMSKDCLGIYMSICGGAENNNKLYTYKLWGKTSNGDALYCGMNSVNPTQLSSVVFVPTVTVPSSWLEPELQPNDQGIWTCVFQQTPPT